MALTVSRRRFFLGLVAAPAIVHIGNLMPVKAMANLRNLEEERFLESMTVAYSPVEPDIFALLPASAPGTEFVPFHTIIRTSLPHGVWRMYNQGIPLAPPILPPPESLRPVSQTPATTGAAGKTTLGSQ